MPTRDELQGIGTDPPATWGSGSPSFAWTMPGAPFVEVQDYVYWSYQFLPPPPYDPFVYNPYEYPDVQFFVNMIEGWTNLAVGDEGPFHAWPVR